MKNERAQRPRAKCCSTTATVEYHKEGEDEVKQGVAVFEFDTKTKKIKKLTFYFE